MFVIQVYMPAVEHSEKEVDDMYEKIEQTRSKDYTVVIGDLNAVVGEVKKMDMSVIMVWDIVMIVNRC